jgi:para-aminobenzoate synthetase/4-amino-4-deoxychorismate lyase
MVFNPPICRCPDPDSAVIHDAASGHWLLFDSPVEVLSASNPDEVLGQFAKVEEAVTCRGLHAAGWISYDASPAFDSALTVRDGGAFPLLWFGLYRQPRVVALPPAESTPAAEAWNWEPSVTPDEYRQAFDRVKRAIRDGDSYQVNYTHRLRARATRAPWALFLQMLEAQRAAYGAYLHAGPWRVCSASPELFFRLDGTRIESRPMKGTAARGRTADEDRAQAAALHASAKNRAENVMIVDMVRNDLGRIAVPGSVRVPELFAIERYPTLWQMTSTVTAETRAPVVDLFRALFPAASITGAPKCRTMRLLAEIETAPRGIYTGAIGFLAPGRRAQFSVAIRTLLVDASNDSAEYGVGGGLVWDSECASEQAECRIKAAVLAAPPPRFSLLETLRWTPADGFHLLDRHLARIAGSAEYFGYPFDESAVRKALLQFADSLPRSPRRVRMLIAPDGTISCESQPLSPPDPEALPRVFLALRPVNRANPFLYHKTTHRKVYEEARADHPEADDVILFNESGEATESTLANLVAEIDGVLATPPVRCGLLPGTCRAAMLDAGEIVERPISIAQLLASPRVFLVNSVRGMRRVSLHSNSHDGRRTTPGPAKAGTTNGLTAHSGAFVVPPSGGRRPS